MNPRKPNAGELPIQIPANEMTVRASFPPKPRARANRPGHSCVCGRTLVARAGATGLSGEQSDAIIREGFVSWYMRLRTILIYINSLLCYRLRTGWAAERRLMISSSTEFDEDKVHNLTAVEQMIVIALRRRAEAPHADTGLQALAWLACGVGRAENALRSLAGIHELLTSHARSRYRWRTTCDSAISVHERAMLDLLSACQHGDAYRAGLLLRFLVRRDARTRLAEQATMLAEALRAGSRMLPHRPAARPVVSPTRRPTLQRVPI